MRTYQRPLIAFMCTSTFVMGYFCGTVFTSIGIPGYAHGPVLLITSAGLFFYLYRDRNSTKQ